MSSKVFKEIEVKLPKNPEALERSYQNCRDRNKFVEVNKEDYSKHLELAKDDLNAISSDYEKKNWRWVITKSYYCILHSTNALLVNKLGFFSKDHLCAVLALRKNNLISEDFFDELKEIYEKFSDIFGFAVVYEARKLSQYDAEKWKEITEEDAMICKTFAKKFVSYVEEKCQ